MQLQNSVFRISLCLKWSVYKVTHGEPIAGNPHDGFCRVGGHERGTPIPTEPALAKAIALAVGPDVEVKWKAVKWEQIPDAVDTDIGDLGIDAWFRPPNANQNGKINWSVPYLKTGLTYAFPTEKGTVTPEQLKSLKGVAYDDPAAKDFLKGNSFKNVKYFDTEQKMYKAFTDKKADYIVFDKPLLYHWAATQKGKVTLGKGILKGSEGDYALYVKDGNPEFLALINKTIDIWLKSDEGKKLKILSE